jgi:hypothetical protein
MNSGLGHPVLCSEEFEIVGERALPNPGGIDTFLQIISFRLRPEGPGGFVAG